MAIVATPSRAHRPAPLPALTGIRFVAALHVVLYHYASDVLSGAPWWTTAIIASGPSAVGLFYVLSGAVLVYSCTDTDGRLAVSSADFWRARFARIYPTYLLALILGAPFFISAVLKTHDGGAATIGWGLALAAAALLLVHGWTALSVFAWNIPGWSLSAEAFFYAIFPSLVTRLRCRSLSQLVSRASVFYALALVPPLVVTAAAMSGNPLLDVQFPAGPGGQTVETWIVRLGGFSPLARLPEFLIGICLGHWLRTQITAGPRGTELRASRGLALEAAAVAALAGAFVFLGSRAGAKPWLDSGMLAPLFVLLVAALAVGSGPLARVLSTRPMQVLGDASYALYILQEPVLMWTATLPIIGTLPKPLFVLLYLAVLVGASIACQRMVAEPVRRWLMRLPDRRAPSPGAMQPA